jgi:hypothetical protein
MQIAASISNLFSGEGFLSIDTESKILCLVSCTHLIFSSEYVHMHTFAMYKTVRVLELCEKFGTDVGATRLVFYFI